MGHPFNLEGILTNAGNLLLLGYIVGVLGRWIGGKANQNLIRTSLAWALIPYMTGLILGGIVFYSFHGSVISSLFSYVELLCLGWSLILGIICVSEAHQIPAWKSILSLIIGTLVIIGINIFLGLTLRV